MSIQTAEFQEDFFIDVDFIECFTQENIFQIKELEEKISNLLLKNELEDHEKALLGIYLIQYGEILLGFPNLALLGEKLTKLGEYFRLNKLQSSKDSENRVYYTKLIRDLKLIREDFLDHIPGTLALIDNSFFLNIDNIAYDRKEHSWD